MDALPTPSQAQLEWILHTSLSDLAGSGEAACEFAWGRCCVASTQGRLKANIHWDQIAKTSSSNATATRRLAGSSTASS
jgi:hypothetical protein